MYTEEKIKPTFGALVTRRRSKEVQYVCFIYINIGQGHNIPVNEKQDLLKLVIDWLDRSVGRTVR
jgi:hypothetical protein